MWTGPRTLDTLPDFIAKGSYLNTKIGTVKLTILASTSNATCSTRSATEEQWVSHTRVYSGSGFTSSRHCKLHFSWHDLAAHFFLQTRVLKTRKLRGDKGGEIAKLFARHIKLEEHTVYLKRTKIGAAVGTSGRLGKLFENGSSRIVFV